MDALLSVQLDHNTTYLEELQHKLYKYQQKVSNIELGIKNTSTAILTIKKERLRLYNPNASDKDLEKGV